MEFGYTRRDIDEHICKLFKGNPMGKHINYYQDFDKKRSQSMCYDGIITGVYPSHLMMRVYGKHDTFTLCINKKDLIGYDAAKVVVL
jgi:hypothetical protein